MIQYPKRTNVTLPSVEGGFGTLPIKRAPPQSLMTYYRPKVGENNDLINLIDASDDRICESIQVYSRNRNPMVSNDFSFGGTHTTSLQIPQAKLPYRLSEVFRPPVRTERSLLPLSRLPRNTTMSVDTNKGSSAMVVDSIISCPDKLREIQERITKSMQLEASKSLPLQMLESPSPEEVQKYLTNTLSYVIETNASSSTEKGIEHIPDTHQYIQNPLKVSVDTTATYAPYSTLLNTNTEVIKPRVRIPLRPSCTTHIPIEFIDVVPNRDTKQGIRKNDLHPSMIQINPTHHADFSAWTNSRERYLRPSLKKQSFYNAGTEQRHIFR